MSEVGFEIHKIANLPEDIRIRFEHKNGFAIKKIFNPIFRIEWEELKVRPSEWLIESLPCDEDDK